MDIAREQNADQAQSLSPLGPLMTNANICIFEYKLCVTA